jgi:hypothetical protein
MKFSSVVLGIDFGGTKSPRQVSGRNVLADFRFNAPLLGAPTLAIDAALRGRADYHPEASPVGASRTISEGLQQ